MIEREARALTLPKHDTSRDRRFVDRHIGNMARGVIDSRDVLYFLTLIISSLLITQASLESRRWR